MPPAKGGLFPGKATPLMPKQAEETEPASLITPDSLTFKYDCHIHQCPLCWHPG